MVFPFPNEFDVANTETVTVYTDPTSSLPAVFKLGTLIIWRQVTAPGVTPIADSLYQVRPSGVIALT